MHDCITNSLSTEVAPAGRRRSCIGLITRRDAQTLPTRPSNAKVMKAYIFALRHYLRGCLQASAAALHATLSVSRRKGELDPDSAHIWGGCSIRGTGSATHVIQPTARQVWRATTAALQRPTCRCRIGVLLPIQSDSLHLMSPAALGMVAHAVMLLN